MALIQCTECGAKVSEHAITCPQCGAPMPIKCRGCGKLLSPNAVICPSCGCPTSSQSQNWQGPRNNPQQGRTANTNAYNDCYQNTVSKSFQRRSGSMSFGEAISQCFSKYATFSGRARRSEYWYFGLFNLLFTIFFYTLSAIGSATYNLPLIIIAGVLSICYTLAVFLPGLAVFVRRLHDIGKSGSNFFWAFLPIIGGIILLVYMLKDSDAYENEYGPSPKYR